MIVATAAWVSGHWKMLLAAGTILASGGTISHNFVGTQLNRIGALEQAQVADSANHREVKCMIVAHHVGDNPLECTVDR